MNENHEEIQFISVTQEHEYLDSALFCRQCALNEKYGHGRCSVCQLVEMFRPNKKEFNERYKKAIKELDEKC